MGPAAVLHAWYPDRVLSGFVLLKECLLVPVHSSRLLVPFHFGNYGSDHGETSEREISHKKKNRLGQPQPTSSGRSLLGSRAAATRGARRDTKRLDIHHTYQSSPTQDMSRDASLCQETPVLGAISHPIRISHTNTCIIRLDGHRHKVTPPSSDTFDRHHHHLKSETFNSPNSSITSHHIYHLVPRNEGAPKNRQTKFTSYNKSPFETQTRGDQVTKRKHD